MGRKGGGHNRLTPEQLKSRMDQIAHLDPTKWGYVKQVSEIWGVSHTQVRRILDSIPSTEQANGPDC